MKLLIESNHLKDYLTEVPGIISFSSSEVQYQIHLIKERNSTPIKYAQTAFEFVRDNIHHSFDTGYESVTITDKEVLQQREGICFAKSHILASLLRGNNIPAGFCYQRVLRKNTIDSGYALHGLNAVYLDEYGWFRLDPRGNKQGVDSQFSITEEKLAYPIRTELGEVDYPNVFVAPLQSVILSMQQSKNCQTLFYNRPEQI